MPPCSSTSALFFCLIFSSSVISATSWCDTCGIWFQDRVIFLAIAFLVDCSGMVSTSPQRLKSGSCTGSEGGTIFLSLPSSALSCTVLSALLPWAKLRTSSAVTSPAGPLPGISLRSTANSRASFLVAGEAGTGPFFACEISVSGVVFFGCKGVVLSSCFCGTPSFSLTWKTTMTLPTLTTSWVLTRTSSTIPV